MTPISSVTYDRGCVLFHLSCFSLWPYRLYPARFLCPWDSPGKNTGVGYHAPPLRNLLNLGIKSESRVSPALQVGSFTAKPLAKSHDRG